LQRWSFNKYDHDLFKNSCPATLLPVPSSRKYTIGFQRFRASISPCQQFHTAWIPFL
jgi:hypothetical protein